MMGLQLIPEEVKQRLADAAEYKYNPEPLGELWGIQRKTAASWLRDYCRKEYYKAMYERKHGEIATPEIREQWDREYWEKM